MSTTLMYDSVSTAGIPKSALIAAGYVNGNYVNYAAIQKRFPHANAVSIDVNGGAPSAMVRDWEEGDKGGDLEQWVIQHNKLYGRKDAVIYCNRSTIGEVRRLTKSQVLNKDYYLWIATGDGTLYGPDRLPGVIACQYLWTANYDVSQVWPSAAVWWTSSTPPAPVAPPSLPRQWTFPPVRHLTVLSVGKSTVKLSWDAPDQPANVPPLPAVTDYEIAVSEGRKLAGNIDTYPRTVVKGANPQVWQGGNLKKGVYTAAVRAVASGDHAGPWAIVTFNVSG